MNPVLTDWLTIATAGPTVDGRTIKEEWLKDAAETYNREEYAAFLNVEHWAGNLGSVWDVRLGKDKKDRTILQARIRPNKYYLQQNAEDHRLCFSVELTHDFAKTGKTYLTGLATTDYPASIGTTEARFSRLENDPDIFRAKPVEIDMGKPAEYPMETGVIAAVKNAVKEIFSTSKNNNGENNMTQEELKAAFTEAVKPLADELKALGQKIGEFRKTPPEQTAAPPKQTEEKFSVENALKELSGKLNALAEDFADLRKGKGKETIPGTGTENDEPLI